MNGNLKESNVEIDILIAIDAGYIKKNYPRNNDPNNPIGIDQNSPYVIGYTPRGVILGQGTTDLKLKILPGDYFTFRTVSIQQNSDDAVFIYKIANDNEDIFASFSYDCVIRQKAVQPNLRGYDLFPVSFDEQIFSGISARVRRAGKGKLLAYIAIYVLGNDGNTQELYGYYYFNLQITAPS